MHMQLASVITKKAKIPSHLAIFGHRTQLSNALSSYKLGLHAYTHIRSIIGDYFSVVNSVITTVAI